MSPTLTILNEMRGRSVAMYVGHTSLSKLADFLRGCQHAAERLTNRHDEFLCEFGDWIRQRFDSPSEAWEKVIVKHSADDSAAVDHFWRLFDEFVRERVEPSAATRPAAGFAVGSVEWRQKANEASKS